MKPLQGVLLAASAVCLFAASARADSDKVLADHWIEIGAKNDVTRYIAASALVRQDQYAVIWRMQNYAAERVIDKQPVRSIKYQVEYNCASHQRRGLYYEMYSGQMGTGDLIAMSYDRDHWRALPVNASHAYQLACGTAAAAPAVVASAP
ncbi:hypothetical protein ACELLULO517_07110 [Acidisoma cellulosilytica]|uniref:Surface-adhesin protein E-like domain-containing protein n=1 Tax=Acidisoma cellulosilyticum TaxID=2802395 RepID=A0A963YZD2_9PROT|nr:surface-adhesin E family protein [Acidisoma cellulosilyticum]MCB8879997.1 hypothetical protein [Acidisoma cellulosilyticum]